MPLEEQTELFAQRIKKLGRFQFLLRPALAEGHIGSAVLPLSIRDLDRDKETGAYQFPDAPLIARLRAALAKHAGIPIARLLQEQESRLDVRRSLTPQEQGLSPVLPENTRRLVSSQPDRHREQRQARVIPTPQEHSQPPAEPPQQTPEKPTGLPPRRSLHQRRYWRS
jgi:hypothetical protein